MYLPAYHRYKTDFDNKNYNLIKKIVNDLGIHLIDIHTEVFEKEENPLKLFPFELYGHYTPEGYKKIAGALFEKLEN